MVGASAQSRSRGEASPVRRLRGRAIVVEDEPLMARSLAVTLRRLGVGSEVIGTFDDAARRIAPAAWRRSPAKWICIDLALDGEDGAELVLRGQELVPLPGFIVPSGRIDNDSLCRLHGLCFPLMKPFTEEQLAFALAETEPGSAGSSRKVAASADRAARAVTVTVSRRRRDAYVNGVPCNLTLPELRVLDYLRRRSPSVVRTERIAPRALGYVLSPQAVRALISRLRDRLGPAGPLVVTVHGKGYRFEEPSSRPVSN